MNDSHYGLFFKRLLKLYEKGLLKVWLNYQRTCTRARKPSIAYVVVPSVDSASS